MFKDITINLTGPICSCREQALSWWPDKDEKGRPTLVLKCKTCATKLIVSNEKFIAGWSLDTPYPGKKKEEPPKPKLEALDGGKVIQLNPLGDPTAVEP